MPTVREIYDYIDSFAPFSEQMSFDNSGLIIGDWNKDVFKVGVSLDITMETIKKAKEMNIDLIVSHHPVIFKAKKRFLKGDVAFELAASGISAICAHTCLDCAADGGVNEVLANLLGLSKVEPLPTAECSSPMVRVGFVGFIGKTNAVALAQLVSDRLSCSEDYCVRYCDGGRDIETVAVCGGSGSSFINEIIDAGIDALITGDAGYHDFLDAENMNFTLISAGHFETENPVVPVLAKKLQQKFDDVFVTVITQTPTVKYL